MGTGYMENKYARLLGLPKNIQFPNYYELLGIEESCFNETRVAKHYKAQLQKVQKLGNNPKYKETILFVPSW